MYDLDVSTISCCNKKYIRISNDNDSWGNGKVDENQNNYPLMIGGSGGLASIEMRVILDLRKNGFLALSQQTCFNFLEMSNCIKAPL